jgi:hypothetical protein
MYRKTESGVRGQKVIFGAIEVFESHYFVRSMN